jgi:hypothetical protein
MEHKRGTGWLVDWLVERRVESHQPAAILYDEKSPAASFVTELEELRCMTTAWFCVTCSCLSPRVRLN